MQSSDFCCNLRHQSSLSMNIELNIMTAACMTLIYQRRCGETFLKEQLKPIGVARLKPARQPLFRLFFLSSPCQPSTKSWSAIPRGESHLVSRLPKLGLPYQRGNLGLPYHGGISVRAEYFPTMMNSFQHVPSGQNMFLALRSIPLENVGGFSWLM